MLCLDNCFIQLFVLQGLSLTNLKGVFSHIYIPMLNPEASKGKVDLLPSYPAQERK